MVDQGMQIVEKDGVFHLSGVLNEYADFSPLLGRSAPLRLNLRGLSRLNSIGIRNLLKFLADWGASEFVYEECPSEFVDQVNMIPALLGTKRNGKIKSFFVPFECPKCDFDEEVLTEAPEIIKVRTQGGHVERNCPKCSGAMTIFSDSFFVFLMR